VSGRVQRGAAPVGVGAPLDINDTGDAMGGFAPSMRAAAAASRSDAPG